jgi:hypothetical protein
MDGPNGTGSSDELGAGPSDFPPTADAPRPMCQSGCKFSVDVQQDEVWSRGWRLNPMLQHPRITPPRSIQPRHASKIAMICFSLYPSMRCLFSSVRERSHCRRTTFRGLSHSSSRNPVGSRWLRELRLALSACVLKQVQFGEPIALQKADVGLTNAEPTT